MSIEWPESAYCSRCRLKVADLRRRDVYELLVRTRHSINFGGDMSVLRCANDVGGPVEGRMDLRIRQRGEVIEIVVDGRIRGRLRGVAVTPHDIVTPKAAAEFVVRHGEKIERCDEPDPESNDEAP